MGGYEYEHECSPAPVDTLSKFEKWSFRRDRSLSLEIAGFTLHSLCQLYHAQKMADGEATLIYLAQCKRRSQPRIMFGGMTVLLLLHRNPSEAQSEHTPRPQNNKTTEHRKSPNSLPQSQNEE